MTLTIGIANSITGTGQASDQLPVQQDIVASYQNSTTEDDKQWVDVNASGGYEVEEGHSWLADGTAYGLLDYRVNIVGGYTIEFYCYADTFAPSEKILDAAEDLDRYDLNITNGVINSRTYITSTKINGVATNTLTAGIINHVVITGTSTGEGVGRISGKFDGTLPLQAVNLWDINIEDSTGIVFSNFLAQDSTDLKMLSEVGPDVQFVDGTYPIVEKSVEFGHEWSNYSVVADDSKIPEDPDSPGNDVLGDPLTNPGTPQKNIDVTGYTGTFTGGTLRAIPGTPISLTGDFRIETEVLLGAIATQSILGVDSESTNSFRFLASTGMFQVVIAGQVIGFTLEPDLVVDTIYKVSLERVGSALTLRVNDGSETLSINTNPFTFDQIFGRENQGWIGQIRFIKISQSGVILNHWVCESSPTSLQDTIYDIVSGNHATLTNATLPFFTTEIEGSKLFADGFDNVGGSDGLVPARADGLSALGQPLTNQPTEFIGDYCLFNAPLSVSFYDAAVVTGIDTDLYLAGAAIGLTADAWILLASNPLFFGAVKNILVMYNDTQSGDTLDQINDYLGI